MNKTIVAIVVVAVVVLGGYLLFKGAYRTTPSVPQQPTSQSSAEQAPVAEEKVVVYTDAGYSPATLTVKNGETVTFKNQSSQSMWTASAGHPAHRVYPTTGGCLGSTFDACKSIQPGDSWSFKFDIPGSWGYHNHLNPGDTGIIVVQ